MKASKGTLFRLATATGGLLITANACSFLQKQAKLEASCQNAGVEAIVNGQILTTEQSERLIDEVRLHDPLVNLTETKAQIIQQWIVDRLVADESKRRGLHEPTGEAEKLIRNLDRAIAEFPETRATLEAEAKRSDISLELYRNQMLSRYHEIASDRALYTALATEVVSPTDAEIDSYLKGREIPGNIALITVTFDDHGTAAQALSELRTQRASRPEHEFVSLVWYAFGKLRGEASSANLVESFDPASPDLPDYAKAATTVPEGDVGMTDRSDGTAVVYFVQSRSDPGYELSRQTASQQLWQERFDRHKATTIKNLRSAANIEVCTDP